MNNVNKTLYIPLYGKAYVSRKGIILNDKKAEEKAQAEEQAKKEAEEKAKADRLANPTTEDLLKKVVEILEKKA